MSLHMIEGVTIPGDFNLPKKLTKDEVLSDNAFFDKALELIKKHNALLIAHYYTSPIMQKLCEMSGGFIGDSLEMARVGKESDKDFIIVAGVRFMGETAVILSPNKTIVMPDLNAECSLDLCCREDDLIKAKKEHPNATVVAYANTSAAVKAQSDWIVTSSLAVDLAKYLSMKNEEILWVPDRHLGSYIQRMTDADVNCWPGRCIVHDAFEENAISFVRKEHPKALLLVHPEAPYSVVKAADYVGSTSQILAFAKNSKESEFIIATERNIFYKLQKACPDKTFIDGYCLSCANCPWMELNTIQKLIDCLENPQKHQVLVDDTIRNGALKPLQRMLDFSADLKSGKIRLN